VTGPQHARGTSSPASGSGAPASARASRQPSPALTVDAIGKKCPIPIIMLADRIQDVRVGQTIAVLADDPAAKTDLPAWCELKSHEFLRATETEIPVGAGSLPRMCWSFLVRRSY
jgi:tRNA 2-thiouridine synthesizing protein A